MKFAVVPLSFDALLIELRKAFSLGLKNDCVSICYAIISRLVGDNED